MTFVIKTLTQLYFKPQSLQAFTVKTLANIKSNELQFAEKLGSNQT